MISNDQLISEGEREEREGEREGERREEEPEGGEGGEEGLWRERERAYPVRVGLMDTHVCTRVISAREKVKERERGRRGEVREEEREREEGGERRTPHMPRMQPFRRRARFASLSLSLSLSFTSTNSSEDSEGEEEGDGEEREERWTSQERPGPEDWFLLSSKIRLIFSISSLGISRDEEAAGE